MVQQARLFWVVGLLLILTNPGCALLSKIGVGSEYKADEVDDFHKRVLGLSANIRSLQASLAKIRGRLGEVARGEISFESVKDDVEKIDALVSSVKSLGSNVSGLLSAAKGMLVDAPENYLGPMALHLPKKIELIEESIKVLKKIPGACKSLLSEALSLGKCTVGLAKGSTAQCDAGARVAQSSRGGAVKGRRPTTRSRDSAARKPASGGQDISLDEMRTWAEEMEDAEGTAAPRASGVPGASAPRGGLLIKSLPTGAVVWLGGRRQRGNTPLTVSSLAPGVHRIRLKQGVNSYSGTVRVEPDRYRTVELKLSVPLGRLEVVSTPPEATIELNGDEVGKAPSILRVKAGTHQIALRLEGYAPVFKEVRIRPPSLRKKLRIRLRRGGMIEVREPAGATIFIDGKQQGVSPAVITAAPGRRTVRLEAKGRIPVVKKIRVKAGETAALAISMELTTEERQWRTMIQEEAQRKRELRAKKEAAAAARVLQAAEARRREARVRAEAKAQRAAAKKQRARARRLRLARDMERHEKAVEAHEAKVAPAREKRRRRSILGFSLGGVGVAMAVTSGVLLGTGYSRGEAALKKYNAVSNFDQPRLDFYRDQVETAEAQMIAGGVLGGVSAAVLGFALYQLFTREDIEEPPLWEEYNSSAAIFTSPGGGGVLLQTKF